ncbi:hypothetical protein AB5I41_18450 [Sphingomonas sp. MMS24-JH45]
MKAFRTGSRPDWRRRLDRAAVFLDRYWLDLTWLAWFAIAVWFVWDRWAAIQYFSMGDTDDNMRMMQVRGLLAGQGWFDLTNYRLNPPAGFNIHWSRLVDLPIAALILILRADHRRVRAGKLAAGIRAAAADGDRPRRYGSHRPPPRRAARLAARDRAVPGDDGHDQHVHARSHRPSRLAAGDARRHRRGAVRSAAPAGRRDRRHRDRGVADDPGSRKMPLCRDGEQGSSRSPGSPTPDLVREASMSGSRPMR